MDGGWSAETWKLFIQIIYDADLQGVVALLILLAPWYLICFLCWLLRN